jgi:hypothetical protein
LASVPKRTTYGPAKSEASPYGPPLAQSMLILLCILNHPSVALVFFDSFNLCEMSI